MKNSNLNFVQFSIATLVGMTVVSAFFFYLMKLYSVNTILPWYLFSCLVCGLFIVGKWLATSVAVAAANDPSTPKRVARFDTSYEAELFVAQLAEHEIAAKTVGDRLSGFQAEAPGYVDVMVPASEYERAMHAVSVIENSNDAADPANR